MIKEFKEFIQQGNVMDMAVGIIIGGAFSAIVNSLVADIITPLIGIIIGGIDFAGIVVKVGEASLNVGLFINAILTFLITAFALFLVIRAINKAKALASKPETEAEEEPEEIPADIALLTEIRDLLQK